MRFEMCFAAMMVTALFAMPAAYAFSAGAPHTATPVIDVGQGALITSNGALAGTAPYTYQWYMEKPNDTIYAPVGSQMQGNLSPYLFTTPPGTETGVYGFMLQVTDSASPANTVNSSNLSVTVNPAFLVGPLSSTLSNKISRMQAPILRTNGGIGGTPPYTFQWMMQSPGSSNFTSVGSASNITSYTFVTTNSTPLGTYDFKVEGTDSASSPATAYSGVFAVTVSAYDPNASLTSITSSVSTTSLSTVPRVNTTISPTTVPTTVSSNQNGGSGSQSYVLVIAAIVIIVVAISLWFFYSRRNRI